MDIHLQGLEYEFQLVTELKGKLQTVWVKYFAPNETVPLEIQSGDSGLGISDRQLLLCKNPPSQIKDDFGNIEVATNPYPTYQEAVDEAEMLLDTKVVPALQRCLPRFGLFLPYPIYTLGRLLSCCKHWTISIENHSQDEIRSNEEAIATSFVRRNGYFYTIKNHNQRYCIQIHIPYYYTPPERLSDLHSMSNIWTLPNRWAPLIGYSRGKTWIRVRGLR